MELTQDQFYSCGGTGTIKMPLSVTTDLGYDSSLIIIKNTELRFRDFRETNVSVKCVDSVSVWWRNHIRLSPIYPALTRSAGETSLGKGRRDP
jgi:hypothetical protein